MQIRSRHWTVLIRLEPDSRIDVQIAADGKVLLPLLRDSHAEEVLVYVEQTLVDMQPGDTLEAAVHCAAAQTQTYTGAAPTLALAWLGEVLQQALCVTKLAHGVSRPATGDRTLTGMTSESSADDRHEHPRPPRSTKD